ncbi:MAG TPA: sugar ABC transporter permease [Deinococcales bacterium]|nr:sugar ABC transporter permease [Deinococcales bacterium]
MRDSVILTRRLALAFLLPAGALLFAFLVIPAVWSLLQGFTNFTLLGPDALNLRFSGLSNYTRALTDPAFWNALKVSVLYVVGSAMIGQAGLGLLLAFLTHKARGWIPTTVRSLAVLAWITPGVVVAILWNVYLHSGEGTLNRTLGLAGIPAVNWLFDRPILAIILYNVWRGTAFSMLLFDAALRTIPVSYYEAASVSGASGWRQFVDITLPLIRPQIATDLLLITLWTFNDFGPYLLTGGGPSFQTEVLPIYTYRVAFRSFELGYGAALSTLLLLINFALAFLNLRQSRRRV